MTLGLVHNATEPVTREDIGFFSIYTVKIFFSTARPLRYTPSLAPLPVFLLLAAQLSNVFTVYSKIYVYVNKCLGRISKYRPVTIE